MSETEQHPQRSDYVLLHELLAPRELEVFTKIAVGRSVAQTAKDMGLAASTVSTLRKRIMQRMKMENNADIIRYAIRNGLMKP